jgi:hypothetical protein
MSGEFQSAKVYVLDFHFKSNDKQEISKKKAELDRDFDELLIKLKEKHGCLYLGDSSVVEEIFLRKH